VNDDIYHDSGLETISRADLEALQEERLLAVVERAYEHSALTRQIWDTAGVHPRQIKSLADFRALAPMMHKDDVLAFSKKHGDPFGGLLCGDPSDLDVVGSTSGTTGDPMPIPMRAGGPMQEAYVRDFHMIGHRPGDYLVFNIASFRPCHYGDFFATFGARAIMLDHTPDQIDLLVEASLRYRPTVLYMLSTPLILALEQYEADHDIDLREILSCYRTVVYAGEPISSRIRELLQRWDIDPVDHSGLADVEGTTECLERDGLHIWEDIAFVESLDFETRQEVADGELGELVATALTDLTAPLVRVRSGDAVRITRETCGCGRTHGRMKIAGRKADQLVVAGRAIFPMEVREIVERIPACSAGLFQLLRTSHETDVLKVRVGYRPAALEGTLDHLALDVALAIKDGTGLDAAIELVDNAELLKLGPPHKIPRLAAR
jgi:phenylacetate-CoA ligase